MRILHLADVHIGVENYGRVDPDTGLSTRLMDFLHTFDQAVDFAIDNRVDLFLFCGDAYKSRDPSQTHQREFARRVARLSAEGIAAFLLIGNHDTPHVFGKATSLEIFKTLEVPNVTIGSGLRTYRVETRSGPLQVLAVPWVRRSVLLATDETRGLNPDQVNELIEDRLVRAIRSAADSLDPAVPAVLSGHLSVGEATLASEQSMMVGRDYVLQKSDLALPQLEYVALGHVHRHQVLSERPHVVYSGSLQRVDFGEEKDRKGFCVVDLDPGLPRGFRMTGFSFEPVDAREFVTISVEVPRGDLDPTATVLRAISARDLSGAVVRVQISLPAELDPHLRESDIRHSLDDAHFVASISREIEEERRTRLESDYTKALDPQVALETYFAHREVPADRAQVLMTYARQLIAEDPEP